MTPTIQQTRAYKRSPDRFHFVLTRVKNPNSQYKCNGEYTRYFYRAWFTDNTEYMLWLYPFSVATCILWETNLNRNGHIQSRNTKEKTSYMAVCYWEDDNDDDDDRKSSSSGRVLVLKFVAVWYLLVPPPPLIRRAINKVGSECDKKRMSGIGCQALLEEAAVM